MEKTNGIWSHKDGALKCGDKVMAFIRFEGNLGDIEAKKPIFDWVCKTLNEQEGLAKERLEKYLKDLKPIVNETNETHEKDCNHTLADEFILLLKHKKNDKQVIMNGLDSSKTAKLYLGKVIMNGKETFKLIGFENILRKEQLPEEYTNSAPYFYFNHILGQIVMLLSKDTYVMRFNIGEVVDPEYIKDFKACGDRLASINKKLKEVKPERFTVKI